MAIAAEHNPGFSGRLFAESLSYLQRIPDLEFSAYGMSPEQIASMRRQFEAWQGAIGASQPD
jgi:hypothetical protein